MFKRGEETIDEEGKSYLKEDEREWGFIHEEGKREILDTFGKQIMIQDRHLSEKIEEFRKFVDRFEELKDTIQIQKTLAIIDYVDELVVSLLGERKYLRILLKEEMAREIQTEYKIETGGRPRVVSIEGGMPLEDRNELIRELRSKGVKVRELMLRFDLGISAINKIIAQRGVYKSKKQPEQVKSQESSQNPQNPIVEKKKVEKNVENDT